jgi:hypothetical protein
MGVFLCQGGGQIDPSLIHGFNPIESMGLAPSDVEEAQIANCVAGEGEAKAEISRAVEANRR